MNEPTLGVYVHIPFCERVCPYCDFAVLPAKPFDASLERRYVDVLLREIQLRETELAGCRLETIYFGGGTPSLFHPASIERLIEGLIERTSSPEPSSAHLEVTLELNPGTAELERLAGFRRAGVNRLSIGVQSFHDPFLKRLGRAHRVRQISPVLRESRRVGYENVSLDLIFGIPGQSVEAWSRDLEQACLFGPEHLSVYGLTIESTTPYARGVASGVLLLPAEEDGAAMYVLAQEQLEKAGFVGYELSNFSRPGFESRHNRRYWLRQPVVGLGMSAVSNGGGVGCPRWRSANPRDLHTYLERVECGELPLAESVEVLTEVQARFEAVFLSLRCREGIDATAFEAEFGGSPLHFYGSIIARLVAAGLLDDTDALHLTPRGRLLSDSVFSAFV